MELYMKKLFKGLVILTVLLQLAVFAGCSKSASSKGSTAMYDQVTNGVTNAPEKSAAAQSPTSDTTSTNSANLAQAADSRKIIMSANISMQTTTYDKAVASLEDLVNQDGGFVQDSSTQGTGKSGNDRTASYTVRIPSDKLDTFISGVGGIGKVISKSKKGEDVTQNYFDTDAHLTTLNAEKTRILDILSKTQNITDVITVEQKLTDIDNQIEQLTGELQKMDSLIDMSTVTININEVVVITNTPNNFGGQVLSVLQGSSKALIATLKVILIGIIAILPFVIVFGAVAAVIFFIVRNRRKHKKKTDAT
jgi:hypothetical protein